MTMITIRKSKDRGHANYGWLDTYHSFSFADYYDRVQMGFSSLRVINEDFIQAGEGFPTHGHRDMEIITYVVSGSLEHKDTLGTAAVIHSGEIQKITAGQGIRHSEFNPDKKAATHLLQIWILPDRNGYSPSYDQKSFTETFKKNELVLIASPQGREGSIQVHQNMDLLAARPQVQSNYSYLLKPDRKAWIQVIKGEININGHLILSGDGAAISEVAQLKISTQDSADFLLFDLP
jgi:redox-sensitive bicupin YhaK (pirin superfamily)